MSGDHASGSLDRGGVTTKVVGAVAGRHLRNLGCRAPKSERTHATVSSPGCGDERRRSYELNAPGNVVVQAPVGDLKLLSAKDVYLRFLRARARFK
jgi:hypothetical protein